MLDCVVTQPHLITLISSTPNLILIPPLKWKAKDAKGFLQTQNKSTRFVEYISLEVLPQLHCITDPDVQSQVLKTLGEACMNSSEVKQPDIAVNNIYQKLMVGWKT